MSQINITPDEFADLIICFILDNFRSEDALLPDNELWNDFLGILDRKGIEPRTLQYYMKLDSRTRLDYKRIKSVFHGDAADSSRINITKTEPKPDRKSKSDLKDTIKKVIKLGKQVRESSGFPVNDEKLDKIINYVLEQEEKENG